jgi:hypothetical protein
LALPVAATRVSRVALEVLGEQVMPRLRMSRIGLEVLGEQVVPRLQVSRVSSEVLGRLAAATLQVSRVGVEVLGDPIYLQVSQVGLEILGSRKESKVMFTFEAPYPAVQTTSLLPSPEFSDQEGVLDSVTRKLAMDGTRYTYVKRRSGRRKLKWTFILTRNKALEVRGFIYAYFASKVRVTDHNGRIWIGNFVSNPFEFEATGRAAPALTPLPRGESWTVDIEFEGVEQ